MGLDLSERPGTRRAPHFHSSISERCADQMAPEECLGAPQDQGHRLCGTIASLPDSNSSRYKQGHVGPGIEVCTFSDVLLKIISVKPCRQDFENCTIISWAYLSSGVSWMFERGIIVVRAILHQIGVSLLPQLTNM
jgi:hypothetical protein